MRAALILAGWALAVVVAVGLGSLVQTQFNLAALGGLGVPVGLAKRFAASWHDLVHFTPTYGILVAIAFAIAWPVAGFFARRIERGRNILFVVAGFAAVTAMILIMNRALPVTGIAATRGITGTLAMSLTGAVAGWFYALVAGRW